MTSEKSTILTCVQPTNQLTLGNYLGAIRNWISFLENSHCFFGIVDHHALTTPYVPAELRHNTLSCIAQYIACGLDPEKATIFVQSHIVGHTELAWILGCLTPIGDLQRMTQFKEKAAKLGFSVKSDGESGDMKFKHEEAKPGASVNAGLLYYPVLMAADILLYNADIVPTGEDQKQHLELCRNLARRFNQTYSETFTIPEPMMGDVGARVMSLTDPVSKMSKSDENNNGTIYLLDKPEVVRKKIMSAVTDSGKEVRASEQKPGITNLLGIYCAIEGLKMEAGETRFKGANYGEFKAAVADSVIACLEPLQCRYYELMEDKSHLEGVIAAGAREAQKKAYGMLAKVYRKIGFLARVK